MKKYPSIITWLALVLTFGLLAGCATKPAAPTSAPAGQATPAPAAPAPTVKLVYASGYAPTHAQVGILAEEWATKIKAATGDRVQIRAVHAGSLLKGPEILDGVEKRTADAGSLVVAFWPGKLPMSVALGGTVDLNLGSKIDLQGVAAITSKLVADFPEFAAEYKKLGVTPVLFVPTSPYAVLCREPVRTLDGLKNKKIRTFGDYLPRVMAAAGAVPVALAANETYTALQTGVVDCVYTDVPAVLSEKWFEVAKFITSVGPGYGPATIGTPVVYVVNNESLNQLSEADRAAFLKVSGEITRLGADSMTKARDSAVVELKKQGVELINLSQADYDKWRTIAPNFVETRAKELNDKKLPGTELMKKYEELANDYISGKWKPWQ